MTCDPTKHFLPDYHHWGDISGRIERAIKVPIRRVPHVPQWTGDPPFLVYSCSWSHLDVQGPLTEEWFNHQLDGAILDFAGDINKHEEFVAYPITHKPPTTEGRAYHDWIGAAYPFDLRVVIDYDTNIAVPNTEELFSGLKFHISTLISTDMKHHGD